MIVFWIFYKRNGIVVDFQNILTIHHIKRICPQLMSDTFLSSTLKQQMLSKHFHYQSKRETMAIVLWQLMKKWFWAIIDCHLIVYQVLRFDWHIEVIVKNDSGTISLFSSCKYFAQQVRSKLTKCFVEDFAQGNGPRKNLNIDLKSKVLIWATKDIFAKRLLVSCRGKILEFTLHGFTFFRLDFFNWIKKTCSSLFS